MMKYIGKKLITSLIIIAVVATVLFFLLGHIKDPVLTTTPIHYYDTNEYIPMGDRIAVYNFKGYERGFGMKYLSMFEHTGRKFYAERSSDFPANIISRRSLIDYRLYEFSHFLVRNAETLSNDIANGAEYLSAFDHTLYDLSPYSYADMLNQVYGLSSADDIESIEHTFMQYNSHTTDDSDDIEVFYNAISSLEVSEPAGNYKAGINIVVNLKNGKQISGLHYSRTNGIFCIGTGDKRLEGYIDDTMKTQFEAVFYN